MLKKFIVGAHYGMRDWLYQRMTAAYMIFYTVVFIILACYFGVNDYDKWHSLFAFAPMRFLTFIFFVCALYHAWVGMRDIFMDYVKPVWVKLPLLTITVLVLIGYIGWIAQILWRL